MVFKHRRRYGFGRVTAELQRRGMVVNHKRVARMMREDNLLAIEPRAFMVTTDSDHEREVSSTLSRNEADRSKPAVSDITSIAGVRLFGCDSGRRFAKGCGLGLGRQPGSRSGTSRLRRGDPTTTTRTRSSSPLRSRRPICFWPIRWGFEPAADHSQQESGGESL